MGDTYPYCTECGKQYSTLKGSPIQCDCTVCPICNALHPPSEFEGQVVCWRCREKALNEQD